MMPFQPRLIVKTMMPFRSRFEEIKYKMLEQNKAVWKRWYCRYSFCKRMRIFFQLLVTCGLIISVSTHRTWYDVIIMCVSILTCRFNEEFYELGEFRAYRMVTHCIQQHSEMQLLDLNDFEFLWLETFRMDPFKKFVTSYNKALQQNSLCAILKEDGDSENGKEEEEDKESAIELFS
jgi:hypothetical protein